MFSSRERSILKTACRSNEQEFKPASEEEMMELMMKYVERLVCAIRPRNLLYLAIGFSCIC